MAKPGAKANAREALRAHLSAYNVTTSEVLLRAIVEALPDDEPEPSEREVYGDREDMWDAHLYALEHGWSCHRRQWDGFGSVPRGLRCEYRRSGWHIWFDPTAHCWRWALVGQAGIPAPSLIVSVDAAGDEMEGRE